MNGGGEREWGREKKEEEREVTKYCEGEGSVKECHHHACLDQKEKGTWRGFKVKEGEFLFLTHTREGTERGWKM